VEQIVCIKLVK